MKIIRPRIINNIPILAINNEFVERLRETWDYIGLTPLYILLLQSECGWPIDDIREWAEFHIGEDWYTVKMTIWVERLMKLGVEFPDGEPVLDILNRSIYRALLGEDREA
jgi:hypothetical protein